MTATARVALVIDNTRTQKQRSKRSVPTQSFLTDKHSIYGGKAEIVRTQQSGGYWHFRMWISEESKYVRKTLKTKHLDTAVERAYCTKKGLYVIVGDRGRIELSAFTRRKIRMHRAL